MKAWFVRHLLRSCPGGPKMLHETLCIAQAWIGNSEFDRGRHARDIDRLQWLINLIQSSGAYRPSP